MKQKDLKTCPICKINHNKRTICCCEEHTFVKGKEYHREYQKKFSKTKRGKIWKSRQNKKRRLYMKSIKHDFTKKQWDNKLKKSNGICRSCKLYVGISKLTLDHKFPISKAYKKFLSTGEKTIYTIRMVDAICSRCNASKKDK